jgi:glutamate racemase
MNEKAIGLFDSGVGGLTILRQLTKHLPNEKFIYFGDNARAPYGSKTEDQLYEINEEITQFLLSKDIKLLIMACNTSCSLFLESLQEKLPIPVIGLIKPAAENANSISYNKRFAVIATPLTTKSKAYTKALLALNNKNSIIEIPCPKLVPIIETNLIYSASTFNVAKEYFSQAIDFDVDTIIYGCSHYPFLDPVFKKLTSKFINFINPAVTQIPSVKDVLIKNNITANKRRNGSTQFWISGNTQLFENFLNRHYKNMEYSIKQYQLLS